jgi:hypothetical protein
VKENNGRICSIGFYKNAEWASFATMKARRIESAAEYAQLIRLIKIERAQLIFLPEEEAQFYLKESGYSASDFNIIHFAEMPPGELPF